MSESLSIPIRKTNWSILDSEDLYRVASWGQPYFFINNEGRLSVRPKDKSSVSIDIVSVIEKLQKQGVLLPVLVRFPELLISQVKRLNEAFGSAILESGYGGSYQGVYPIKVNQIQEVVDTILQAGRNYQMGLECGSKAEFLAALSYLHDDQTLLICNGIKDRAMLELMIEAQKLGKKVIPVLEKTQEYAELKSIIWRTKYSPVLGARLRLGAEGSGRWAECSGLRSKFGLSVSELICLVDELKLLNLQDKMQLLHCHLGSQIADIYKLKSAVREFTQIYASLVNKGIGIKYLDVGGGLGVNYEENKINSEGGVNYDLHQYANVIVSTVQAVCDEQGVQEPVLITESGRAITAYHAVLVVPVLGMQDREKWIKGMIMPDDAHQDSQALFNMMRYAREVSTKEALALFSHAKELHKRIRNAFSLGFISLNEHAIMDHAFWEVCSSIRNTLSNDQDCDEMPELIELENLLAHQYICDFSVFRSMPDHWAIGQTFPVMPIERLEQPPTDSAVLMDLTCDSDGQITHYVSSRPNKSVLPVHSFIPGQRNYMGVFLLGAYEDSMGDAHNLFGKVGEAYVYSNLENKNNFKIEKFIQETTVQEILEQLQYFSDDLRRRMSEIVRKKTQSGEISSETGRAILEKYMTCLQKGTYCDSEALGQDMS